MLAVVAFRRSSAPGRWEGWGSERADRGGWEAVLMPLVLDCVCVFFFFPSTNLLLAHRS